jgi:hypothetical protein
MDSQARDLLNASRDNAIRDARNSGWPVVGLAELDTGEICWQAYSSESAANIDGCDNVDWIDG